MQIQGFASLGVCSQQSWVPWKAIAVFCGIPKYQVCQMNTHPGAYPNLPACHARMQFAAFLGCRPGQPPLLLLKLSQTTAFCMGFPMVPCMPVLTTLSLTPLQSASIRWRRHALEGMYMCGGCSPQIWGSKDFCQVLIQGLIKLWALNPWLSLQQMTFLITKQE